MKKDFGLTDADLQNYLPLKTSILDKNKIDVHFLSHYLKWHPQSNYYYAVKHGGFVTSPERMPEHIQNMHQLMIRWKTLITTL